MSKSGLIIEEVYYEVKHYVDERGLGEGYETEYSVGFADFKKAMESYESLKKKFKVRFSKHIIYRIERPLK